jgi:hypothetical protein
MLKVGLIGAGWHAQADHAPALRHCADGDEFRGLVELSGVCDLDFARAKRMAQQFGFRRVYHTIDDMMPEVDAVLSIVPAAALAITLQPIVTHRRPVLVEKPIGRDLAEAHRIAAMLDGHPHMVSLNRRFDPAVQIARKWIAEQSSPPISFDAAMRRRDRTEPDFIWSTGVHLTDLVCWLVGPLAEIGNRSGMIDILADGPASRRARRNHWRRLAREVLDRNAPPVVRRLHTRERWRRRAEDERRSINADIRPQRHRGRDRHVLARRVERRRDAAPERCRRNARHPTRRRDAAIGVATRYHGLPR